MYGAYCKIYENYFIALSETYKIWDSVPQTNFWDRVMFEILFVYGVRSDILTSTQGRSAGNTSYVH
jgi:hypothetical protein